MSRDIGVEDVTRRLVDFADTLKSYNVDIYDIVAMKTLLLLSPGSETFSLLLCEKITSLVYCQGEIPVKRNSSNFLQ